MSDTTVSEKKKKKTANMIVRKIRRLGGKTSCRIQQTFFISRAPSTKSPFPKHLYYYKETHALWVELIHSHFSA